MKKYGFTVDFKSEHDSITNDFYFSSVIIDGASCSNLFRNMAAGRFSTWFDVVVLNFLF